MTRISPPGRRRATPTPPAGGSPPEIAGRVRSCSLNGRALRRGKAAHHDAESGRQGVACGRQPIIPRGRRRTTSAAWPDVRLGSDCRGRCRPRGAGPGCQRTGSSIGTKLSNEPRDDEEAGDSKMWREHSTKRTHRGTAGDPGLGRNSPSDRSPQPNRPRDMAVVDCALAAGGDDASGDSKGE
jgi:hypothetical protein